VWHTSAVNLGVSTKDSSISYCSRGVQKLGGVEVGIKESGIIGIFHQTGKGHKRKGAETERGQNGKWHKGKRHKGIWQNQVFTKLESGIK
jgi:hypothetical protein